jgi:hypothetical protein
MKQQHVGKPWVDKFGRVRQPQQYLEDDDGHLIAAGPQATAMVTALTPAAPAEAPPPPSAARAAARPRGRAPRAATNARTKGSRRGQRASSSSSDDPDPDPDPWDLGPPPPRIPGQIPLFVGWRR